jgi:hypothetical protein
MRAFNICYFVICAVVITCGGFRSGIAVVGVASGPADDPPRSDVIDAALTHLIESHENIDEARGEYSAHEIKELANTSVIGLNYRTSIESKCR